jgi:hypothetical protein
VESQERFNGGGFPNRRKQCQQQFGLILQGAAFWSRQ